MPAVSASQQGLMGAAYSRMKKGKKRSGDPKMPMHKLKEFAQTPTKGLPYRKQAAEHMMKGRN